jgi:hypothetical protein
VAQISREEWLKRFGRGAEAPQPRNVPGLPSPEITPERVLAELEYVREAQANPGRDPRDRQIKRVRGQETRYSRGYGRTRSAEAEAAAARQAAQSEVALREAQAAGSDAGLVELSLQMKEAAGAEFADRVAQYMTVPDTTRETAIAMAQQEVAAEVGGRKGREIANELAVQFAQEGEVRTDIAGEVLAKAANEGIYSPEAQDRPLTADEKATALLEARLAEQLVVKNPEEAAAINAMTGKGRGTGQGRRNPFDKVPGQRVDPYLIPVLLGDPTNEYRGRKQPATVYAKGGTYFDPRAIQVGLLDPRAAIPADIAEELGLTRTVTADQSWTGARDAAVGAPTVEASYQGEVYGLRPGDDPAVRRKDQEVVPMTIGQATKDIMLRSRTPIKDYRAEDLVKAPDGSLYVRGQDGRPTDVQVFPVQGSRYGADSPVQSYRVGSDFIYGTEGFQELARLIESTTGKRLLSNEPISRWDKDVNQIQRMLLEKSTDPELIRTKAGKNPLYDIISLMEGGASMAPAEGSTSILATPARRSVADSSGGVRNIDEGSFYLDLVSPELQRLAADRNVIADQSSAIPQLATANASNISTVNAPASQPPIDNTAALAEIPAAARPNIERGLAAPEGSPSRIGAEEFLARMRGNLRRS